MEFEKEVVKQFFTKFLQDLQEIKTSFKQEIIEKNIVGKQFREAFKTWQNKFQTCIQNNKQTYLKVSDTKFDFESFMTYVGDQYQNDNDIINTIKSIRNEINDLMKFMAPRLAEDKSIFDVKSL